MQFWQYVFVTFILHSFFFASIFEIYLTSPIISGLESLRPLGRKLAKRAVIFSVDGMRHRTFVQKEQEGKHRAEHILNRACHDGFYTKSITQLPTESRPGHVAFLGGFGEDVSAVMAGWKKNPVPFDTILNQSTSAWAWGSPDIVDIFSDPDHVHGFTYPADLEDFSSNNADFLDTWADDNFHNFMKDPPESIHQNGVVFFLHLLGSDTNGHAHRPGSDQYKNNVNVVDNIVRKVEKTISQVFTDEETVFIVTSDHGMTDWGSHGSGSDDETITPFTAWGSGIKHHPTENCNDFSNPKLKSINQIDIAPFISLLLGNPLPANSIGIAPFRLFDTGDDNLLDLVKTNLFQLLHQYEAKKAKSGFQDSLDLSRLLEINEISLVDKLQDVVDGIQFHHMALRPVLSFLVIGMMIIWQFTTLGHMAKFLIDDIKKKPFCFPVCIGGSLVIFSIVSIYRLSLRHIVWGIMPLFALLTLSTYIGELKDIIQHYTYIGILRISLFGSIIILLLTSIFTHRWILSICFIIYPCYTKFVGNGIGHIIWFPLLGIFPFLPTISESGEHRWFVILSIVVVSLFSQRLLPIDMQSRTLINLSLWMALLSQTLIAVSEHLSLHPPVITIYISWCTFVTVWVCPLREKDEMISRFWSISTSCFALYSLLSTFYEGLFFLCLVVVLWMWIKSETCPDSLANGSFSKTPILFSDIGKFRGSDVRRCIVFMMFIMMAFFGCGNVANLNSFSPSSILPFIHVFNPFLMGFLLFFKVVLPFIPVSIAFLIIIRLLNIPFLAIFQFLVIFSDCMAFVFFFQVKDGGSWLEVGLSISHFSITLLMFLSVTLMMVIAHLLTHRSIRWHMPKA